MTKSTLHSNADGWLAELRCHENQAARAAVLLEQVVETLHGAPVNEGRGAKAQRLRGAAMVAQTAALELIATSGWLDGAQAAELHGLLPEADGQD